MSNTTHNADLYGFEAKYSFVQKPNGLCVIDTPKEDNSFVLKFMAKGPGFDLVATALEDATFINHITGKPFIRSSVLYRAIFMSAVSHVEFPGNDALQSLYTDKNDILAKNYNLVKIVCKQWLKDVL